MNIDEMLLSSFFHLLLVTLLHTGVSASEDPSIRTHPSDTYVTGNDPATLYCTAEGHPPPLITWYKDDVMLTNVQQQHQPHFKEKVLLGNNRVQLSDGSLFFLRVLKKSSQSQEPDFGSYYCNATNPQTNKSSISRTAFLKPAILRNDFREHPSNAEVVEGEEILLTCRPPKGDPDPRIKWKKNGFELQTDGSDRIFYTFSNGLRILKTSVQDSGLYSCVAYNIAGERESAPAVVVVKNKSSLSSLIRIPKDMTVMEGKEVTFNCQASEDSKAGAAWKKLDGDIPLERSEILPDWSLKIRNVRLSDEGIYVCSVDSESGRREMRAVLTVHTIPTVSVTPREMVVSQGKKSVVTCQATGNPPPNIFWNHESANTFMSSSSSDGRIRVTENGSLVIESVEMEDAGEYTCQAVSLVGRTSAKVRIDVKELESHPPPVIVYGPQNQTLPIGDSATMLCKATGEPRPSIMWLKNSEPLVGSDPWIQIAEDGTLEINKLRKSDSGLYTCRAISSSGETWWSAYLLIEQPKNSFILFSKSPAISTFPGPPSLPVASDIKQSSLKLSWQPHHDRGSSEVTGYVVEIFCQDCQQRSWVQMSVNSKTSNIVIQNISPDSTYFFVVRSRNSHGLSAPSPISFPVKTRGYKGSGGIQKDDVYEVLTNQQLVQPLSVEAMSSISIRVEWGFIEEYKKYVEGFIIKYQDIERSGPVYSVRSEHASSLVLENLEKFTWYEINVHPFFKHIEGISTPARVKTFEDLPTEAPQNVHATWHGNDSLLITWEHPGLNGRNGILKGYKVYVTNNDTKMTRTTQVDAAVESLMMSNMVKQYVYRVHVSTFNKIGESPLSKEAFVGQYIQPPLMVPHTQSIVNESWFIIVLIVVSGVVLWVVLCVLSVFLFRRHKRKEKSIEGAGNGATVQTCSDNLVRVDQKPSQGGSQFPLLSTHNTESQRTKPCCYENHSPSDLDSKNSMHARSESQGHTYQTLDADQCTYPHTWNPSNNVVLAMPVCNSSNGAFNQQLMQQPFSSTMCTPHQLIQAPPAFYPTTDIPNPASYMIRYPPSNNTSVATASDKNSEASEGRDVYVPGGSSDGSRSGRSHCSSGCGEHGKGCNQGRHQNKFGSTVSSGGSSIKSNVNDSNQPLLYCYAGSHGDYHHDDCNSSHGSSNKSGQIHMTRSNPVTGRSTNINGSGFYDEVTQNYTCCPDGQQKLLKHCNTPVSVVTDTDDVENVNTISSVKSEEYYQCLPGNFTHNVGNYNQHDTNLTDVPHVQFKPSEQQQQQQQQQQQRFKRPQISTFTQDPRVNFAPLCTPPNMTTPSDSSRSSPLNSHSSTIKNTVI